MFTVREAGAAIRDAREKQNLTQGELAARARVSRSFIIDLESGKPTVEASKLFDTAQALGFEIALRSRDTGEVRW
jgi:transcriptional regulator with XRE-family HTH domain